MIERDMLNECYHCQFKKEVPGNAHIRCTNPDPKMKGNPHGVKNGWFFYPILFDPVWKTKMCSNYQHHEAVSDAVRSADNGGQTS